MQEVRAALRVWEFTTWAAVLLQFLLGNMNSSLQRISVRVSFHGHHSKRSPLSVFYICFITWELQFFRRNAYWILKQMKKKNTPWQHNALFLSLLLNHTSFRITLWRGQLAQNIILPIKQSQLRANVCSEMYQKACGTPSALPMSSKEAHC